MFGSRKWYTAFIPTPSKYKKLAYICLFITSSRGATRAKCVIRLNNSSVMIAQWSNIRPYLLENAGLLKIINHKRA